MLKGAAKVLRQGVAHRGFATCIPCSARRTISDLPPKVELEVAAKGRFSNLVPPRRGREIIQRVGSTYGGTHSLAWVTQPHNVLFLAKQNDAKARSAAIKILRYMKEAAPELNVIVEEELYSQLGAAVTEAENVVPLQQYDTSLLPSRIDFVVALGGDGTLLRVSSLFDGGAVPPVLAVNMGTLGFMMPNSLDTFPKALREVLDSRAQMLLRMRLQCRITEADEPIHTNAETSAVHAMNEITLHRGISPHLILIKTHVNGQFLTEIVADGLLLSTPTGSTAYSLSSGGPIVHPSVQSLLLTAIAPRSLSFRTVLLPSDVCVTLSLSPKSRTQASLSLDGHEIRNLLPNQSLAVSMSPYPVPCISRPLSRLPISVDDSGEMHEEGIVRGARGESDDWITDVRRMLKFNMPFSEGREDEE